MKDPGWFNWHEIFFDLNPILGTCPSAMVAGHSIPNQGSIGRQ